MQDSLPDEVRTIEDNLKRTYSVRVSFTATGWYLKVWDGNVRAGYANSGVEADVMHLDDLFIEIEKTRPESFSFLRGLLNWHKKPVKYRRRGLGSALLKLVLRMAVERGFARITADLSPRDIAEFPQLADWYRSHGFSVQPGGRYGAGKMEKILAKSRRL